MRPLKELKLLEQGISVAKLVKTLKTSRQTVIRLREKAKEAIPVSLSVNTNTKLAHVLKSN
ncbi:helix-turn-helix domain-containing protein [Pseudomonas sivasensis]|uniref:Helix-turn-helix domain-containing protein n=1 Tax=Pseudomonas sivasensis TaxID=1880678 RepID=A0ABW8E658_9PSED